MPIWLTWLIEGAGSLLRAFVGAKQATVADASARAATAETQLHEEQSANDVLQEGAAARAGADARVVHDITAPADPGTGPNDALKRDFPQDFRD